MEIASEELEGNIDFRMVYKNGQQNQGIVFFPEGSNVGITTYAEDFYRMYKEGISFPSIIERYKEMIDEAKGEMQFAKISRFLRQRKKILYLLLFLKKVWRLNLSWHMFHLKTWKLSFDGISLVQSIA